MLISLDSKRRAGSEQVTADKHDFAARPRPDLYGSNTIKAGHARLLIEFDDRGVVEQLINDTTLDKESKVQIIVENKRRQFNELVESLGIDPQSLPQNISCLHGINNTSGTSSYFELDCSPDLVHLLQQMPNIISIRDISNLVKHLI